MRKVFGVFQNLTVEDTLTVGGSPVGGGGSASVLQGTVPSIDASVYTPVLGGAPGNVSNGTHRYKFTYFDGTNETDGSGDPTPSVTVTDNSVDGQVYITLPYASGSYQTVNVYRDKDGDGIYKLIAGGPFSMAPACTDNTDDGALGAEIPATPTLVRQWSIEDGLLRGTGFDHAILARDNIELRVADSPSSGSPGGALTIAAGAADSAAGGDLIFQSGVGSPNGAMRFQQSFIDQLVIDGSGVFLRTAILPTSDPHVAGQLWLSGTDLQVSLG